jgi:hypothetical protein
MRDPNLKALTVYVDKVVYALVKQAADEEDRSVTNYLAGLLKRAHPPTSGRQVDIEDAISAVVKRGPVKLARHK